MQIRVNSTDDINVDDIVEFKVMNEEMEIIILNDRREVLQYLQGELR